MEDVRVWPRLLSVMLLCLPLVFNGCAGRSDIWGEILERLVEEPYDREQKRKEKLYRSLHEPGRAAPPPTPSRKSYTCSACEGEGRKECASCNGTGSGGVCSCCDGQGVKVNPVLHGWRSSCHCCEGRGFVNCVACKGRGSTKCSRCRGTGTVSF